MPNVRNGKERTHAAGMRREIDKAFLDGLYDQYFARKLLPRCLPLPK